MYKPEYNGNCIVNLVSSLMLQMGSKPIYPQLDYLKNNPLSNKKKLIFLIIDGLGAEYLRTRNKESIFNRFLKTEITSVFPSTTAAAITSFASGLSTQEHAMTGWFVFLKELGCTSVILPFSPRFGDKTYSQSNIAPEKIFNFPTIFENLNRNCIYITPQALINTDYNNFISTGTTKIGYSDLDDFAEKIINSVSIDDEEKFIYGYWSLFDKLSHIHGVGSKEINNHFKELEGMVEKIYNSVKDKNTTIVITADHGLLNTEPEKIIKMKDHPKLKECLHFALSGEPRTPYCYVKVAKVDDFKKYIRENLFYSCDILSADEAIKMNLFGLYKENSKLRDRIGDFILIMKDNYVFHDPQISENETSFIGYHGGLSKTEMLVPLIIIQ